MTTVGITGGIGSGKTTICRIFSELGIAVYNADDEARQMYGMTSVQVELKKLFGEKIFRANGDLDKKKLADLIFNDEKALKEVNILIHPMVKKHFDKWREQQTTLYVLKEAAILFESGSYKDCKKVIAITAPPEMRIGRILQRDRRSRKEIEQIMAHQWTDEKRIKHSDFVIANDETKLLIPQVLEIHNNLLKLLSEN